jgi:hypothetical protein
MRVPRVPYPDLIVRVEHATLDPAQNPNHPFGQAAIGVGTWVAAPCGPARCMTGAAWKLAGAPAPAAT